MMSASMDEAGNPTSNDPSEPEDRHVVGENGQFVDPNGPTLIEPHRGPPPPASAVPAPAVSDATMLEGDGLEGDGAPTSNPPSAHSATAHTILEDAPSQASSASTPSTGGEPIGWPTPTSELGPTILEEAGGSTMPEAPLPESAATLLEDAGGQTAVDASAGSGAGFNVFPSKVSGPPGSSPSRLRSGLLRSSSSRFESSSSSDPITGELYAGKYELLNEIARGGMGVVYRARQIDLNRIVALKVMLSGALASDRERRRFLLEAEASARLKHPNIVPVYDIGDVGGNLYFTMDFVEGLPLSDRKEELDRDQLLEIMIKTCDGVAYAHQRGIIHRDLKPDNIMTNDELEPLIMDFGLAKQVEVADEDGKPSLMTREGSVMGTPHYMPPEQAEGLISEIDVRSDVYALGVILYELFTGELPFQGRTISELMLKILEKDPKPPRQVDPTIDMDLEAIILKTIEKEKDKRYSSAGELRKDLVAFRDGLTIDARRATVIYRFQKWTRRNRQPLALGVIVVALLTAAGSIAVYKSFENERRNTTPTSTAWMRRAPRWRSTSRPSTPSSRRWRRSSAGKKERWRPAGRPARCSSTAAPT